MLNLVTEKVKEMETKVATQAREVATNIATNIEKCVDVDLCEHHFQDKNALKSSYPRFRVPIIGYQRA